MRAHLVLALAAILGGSLLAPAHARPEKREQMEQRDNRGNEERGRRQEQERDHREERGRRDDRPRNGNSHKGVLTRDEAARRAQRQYGGRVLSVDLLQSDDAPARYRIKLLSDGNVRTVDVDALED
jgi:uncharacterized membrane protein YkoI